MALYSHQPYQWVTEGPDADQEIAAPGYENVWICQLGRASVDGSFQDFITAITQAELNVRGLEVQFDSPGNGVLEFDFTGPLILDGVEISMADYPRFDNPYAQVGFGELVYEISYQGMELYLDFANGVREIR